jgi:predicted ATPase/class 3 adenylate cyclase
MTDQPAGTFTFLYTDIEGSTRLWEQQREAMRRALQRHDAILRAAIESNHGEVFRTEGDAFCAAFLTAHLALAAAAQAQRLLYAEAWEVATPLRVRMALHTGAAERQHGEYVGASLNRIGRLRSVCHGGQTLMTQATQQLVRDDLPQGTHLLDLGQHRFRDLLQPERVYQLAIDGLPDHFPLLNTLEAFPNNLPVQITSFVGRQRELEEVRQRLDAFHLLSLTGPGGTGKTRLALQTAAGAIDRFPDGVWLVELAPLADPALVPQNIASVLGLRESPGQPLLDLVVDYLHGRNLLLVLDNCEHLVETCAQVADRLLRACPDLKILVSSREALGIEGEVTFRVPPLSLPEAQTLPGLDELRGYEAVQLFQERGQAVNARFSLTAHNAEAVARICRRLDGIPLALELAAARLKLFSPEQIASRLDDRFRLLTGGSRTALPRQQTLQAMIDWSYDQLSEAEQTFFRRLSVFAGGWSFEAAEFVCSGEADGSLVIEPFEVMDLLAQLVNKSLVLADEQGEESRYRFLETVRQYASEKLLASGEATRVRDRHLAFFSREASQNEDSYLPFSIQRHRITWLERELDNLRSAQEWALEHNLDRALQIVADTYFLWVQRGYGSEVLRFLRQAIQKAESLPAYQPGGSSASIRWLALAWMAQGAVLMGHGQLSAAEAAYDHSLQLSGSVHAEDARAYTLFLRATSFQISSGSAAASDSIQEVVEIARRLDDQQLLAVGLLMQASIVTGLEGYSPGRDWLLKIIQEFDQSQHDFGSAMARMQLAFHAFEAANYDEAQRYYQESYALYEKVGASVFQNICRSGLADVARMKGDFPQAIHLYQETIAVHLLINNRGAVARCLECLAFITLAQSQPLLAANLFGAAETIRETSQSAMTSWEVKEYEEKLAELHTHLEPEKLESAWARGRSLGLEGGVALAKSLTGADAG